MKIASLGSGSKGNATLVSGQNTTLLIDCGFSLKKIEEKAQNIGLSLDQLDAILVTHEHSDHMSGVSKLALKYQIPVYLTVGSDKKMKPLDSSLIHHIHGGLEVDIGDFSVLAVTVPHDCNEPVQFVFTCKHSGKKLGVLTDIGHVSSHVVESYSGLDSLFLEFNYDEGMLENGPYPYSLKQRVSSDYGHLSNRQSLSLLNKIDSKNMQNLIIGHISEKNNHPDIICNLLSPLTHLPKPLLATQADGFSWIDL